MGLVAIKRMAAQEELSIGKKIQSGDAHNTLLGLISASVRNPEAIRCSSMNSSC